MHPAVGKGRSAKLGLGVQGVISKSRRGAVCEPLSVRFGTDPAMTPMGMIVSDPACLLVFQNPFGFFLPEETRGCSAWGRILKVWRSDSAVKTDLPVEFNARLLLRLN
jgi:hypothetical protein